MFIFNNFIRTSMKKLLQMTVKNSVLACLLAGGVMACSHLPVQTIPETANPSEEIEKLATEQQDALNQQVDVLAPTYFSEASEALKNARESRSDGDETKDILAYVAEGKANLLKANEIAKISRSSLGSVVAARKDALTANAQKILKKDFEDADNTLMDATKNIEDNKLGAADEARDSLTKRYAALELNAIKIEKLRAARATIEKAENEGAKESASRTLAEAKKVLASADGFITANRHDKAGIDNQSKTATESANRLLDITRQVKVADKVDSETAVLAREAQSNKLSAEVAAGKATTAELADATATSDSLTAKNSEMAAQKLDDQRVSDVRAKFASNEAEVYRQGDKLIIRIKTIAFPSGKSTLPSGSFPVLGKVQQVIDQLSASHVTVEGHTDAVGSSDANKKLSDERATAIRAYLSANGYDDSNISTVGYGDSKPLASNKTAAGRAQNRRVDVIIEPKMMH